ncbi:LCP family protein [Antrihabitans stalactiti]|uniref:LytR family transcriptional regulator n=1 Tax=Antrihabitans stalactiti TaxID=2584121 RepID=A0A848KLL2_9NOCA|nr:LytR family transcriptional regulator [Antrihabitans stalactiti]
MGDDRTPGQPPADNRAPWERYFVDPPESSSNEPRSHAATHESLLTKLLHPARDRSVSVSDLVTKFGKREHRPADETDADTAKLPRITDDVIAKMAANPSADRSGMHRAPAPPTPPVAMKKLAPSTEPAPKPPPTRQRSATPVPPIPPEPTQTVQEAPATPVVIPPTNPDVARPQLTRLAMSRLRRKRRVRIAGRSIIALVAIMSLTLTGYVWYSIKWTDSKFSQVAALDPDSPDVVDAVGQTGDETYLIVGTDTRAGQNGELGAGTDDQFEGTARSDTVMLVNIPANRQRVVAVSFPRDLNVDRPVCQGWDNRTGTYTNETFESAPDDKLNATYALGGPKCLVKVIQKMSGLKIGHFVGMDFSGFESMVDEVGGVEVCTTQPLVDDELGPILEKAGRQTISGKTALSYVRARNIESEGNGDYGRIKRQQRFISSLLRSALSNKVLLDPGKLNGFISAFTRETFVQNVNTKDLVTLGRSLQKVDAGAVTFLTVPTAGTTEWGNEIPRTDDIKAIFHAIISDDPLPGEERSVEPSTTSNPSTSTSPTTAAPTTEDLAMAPSNVTLQVSNASGVPGLAASTASTLGAYGFGIYQVDNYSGESSSTVVRYSSGHKREAETVASSIPEATIEETTGLGSIVELVVGSDFAGTVKAPKAAGTPLNSSGSTSSTSGSSNTSTTTAAIPSDLDVTNAGDDSCS